MSNDTAARTEPFEGNFEVLVFLAGSVPMSPSMVDFDCAMTSALCADPFTVGGVAAIWYSEAVRWRRGHANADLDIEAINAATAAGLRKWHDRHMETV